MKEKRNAKISFFFTLIGLFMIIAPSIFNIDIFEGGGALIFVGIFISITAFIVMFMFLGRSKIANKMFNGENVLVEWKYTETEWNDYILKEDDYRAKSNKFLFIILLVISLIIGLAFFIADPEAGGIVFLVLMAVVLICGIAAILSVKATHKNNVENPDRRAIITKDGVYLNKKLDIWKGNLSTFEEASIDLENSILSFTYSVYMKNGKQYYTVNVPIPNGKEEQAKELLLLNFAK